MKNFLVFIKYKVSMEEVERHTPDHREYLQSQYERGILLLSGPFVPRTAGVLWARASDRSEVEAMIAQDPFQVRGVASYEIQEFKPVMFAEQLRPILEAQDLSAARN
jgi:uncharacterized protein YciI